MQTILKGVTKEIIIGIDKPFVIIGEKINPTGHKKLAAALTEGNFDYVRQLVERQIAWGADVLDVNVGVPGLDDEVAMMPKVVALVASLADVPLCLDSGNQQVLAAGLAAAPGKPLVNSVSGEEKRLAGVLPIVKDRGAAVIGLTMDDNGIPKTAEERVAVAEKILERARSEAEHRGWAFERIAADLDLVRRLLNGPQSTGAGEWDADFLVVPPGQKIVMAYDDEIIEAQE